MNDTSDKREEFRQSAIAWARIEFNKELFDAAVRAEVDRLRKRTAWQRFKGRFIQRPKGSES